MPLCHSFPVTDIEQDFGSRMARVRGGVGYGMGGAPLAGLPGAMATGHLPTNAGKQSNTHTRIHTNPAPILRPPAQYWRQSGCHEPHTHHTTHESTPIQPHSPPSGAILAPVRCAMKYQRRRVRRVLFLLVRRTPRRRNPRILLLRFVLLLFRRERTRRVVCNGLRPPPPPCSSPSL